MQQFPGAAHNQEPRCETGSRLGLGTDLGGGSSKGVGWSQAGIGAEFDNQPIPPTVLLPRECLDGLTECGLGGSLNHPRPTGKGAIGYPPLRCRICQQVLDPVRAGVSLRDEVEPPLPLREPDLDM
jgi:hypothetical protein